MTGVKPVRRIAEWSGGEGGQSGFISDAAIGIAARRAQPQHDTRAADWRPAWPRDRRGAHIPAREGPGCAESIAPRKYVSMPVRVVDIDEASLLELGQWPWPRDRLAALVGNLVDMGAAAI